MYACICMYVYVCMYMYACICMYMYVCICICVYAYMCMYVCITYWGELSGGMSYPKREGELSGWVIVRGKLSGGELSRGEFSYTRKDDRQMKSKPYKTKTALF